MTRFVGGPLDGEDRFMGDVVEVDVPYLETPIRKRRLSKKAITYSTAIYRLDGDVFRLISKDRKRWHHATIEKSEPE